MPVMCSVQYLVHSRCLAHVGGYGPVPSALNASLCFPHLAKCRLPGSTSSIFWLVSVPFPWNSGFYIEPQWLFAAHMRRPELWGDVPSSQMGVTGNVVFILQKCLFWESDSWILLPSPGDRVQHSQRDWDGLSWERPLGQGVGYAEDFLR